MEVGHKTGQGHVLILSHSMEEQIVLVLEMKYKTVIHTTVQVRAVVFFLFDNGVLLCFIRTFYNCIHSYIDFLTVKKFYSFKKL